MNNHKEVRVPIRRRRLRPEAGAIKYSELYDQQKKAFEKLGKLLIEAVGDIQPNDQSTNPDPACWIDGSRASRAAFIDGYRGTGKTMVLLSIMNTTQRTVDDKYPANVKEIVGKLSGNVVWLEPIDMEPLPDATNLLAAILARIDRAVRHKISDSSEKKQFRGSALGWSDECQDALLGLQSLQTSVGIAWDGNLHGRSGNLDPDSYSVEVVRAEMARLSLNQRLSDCLDNLAKQLYSWGPIVDPLFILPIDDVDLYPLRCLEILRLLRFVSVRRLFFVVLGNADVMDLVVNIKYSNEFASIYEMASLDLLSVDSKTVSKNACEVAANSLRKLLPPSQRIELGRMEAHEAFNFRPNCPEKEELLYLHQMLEKCRVFLDAWNGPDSNTDEPGWGIKNAKQLLLGNQAIEERVTKTNVDNFHYTAKRILYAPPRRIADWWLSLQDLLEDIAAITGKEDRLDDTLDDETKKRIHRRLVYYMGKLCRNAFHEDPFIDKDQRTRYQNALRLSPAGIWELVEIVDSIPDIDRAYTLFGLIKPAGHPWPDSNTLPRLLINHGKGWHLTPGSDRSLAPPTVVSPMTDDYEFTGGAKTPRFNPDTTYALMLFHDLLGLGDEWQLMKQSVQINRPIERWAATLWRGDSNSGAWISWPAPSFLSYWEYDLFVSLWNDTVDKCIRLERTKKSIEGSLHPLVYGWIKAGVTVLNRCTDRDVHLESENNERITGQWSQLAKEVGGLVGAESGSGIRGSQKEEWVTRLGYFLTPSVSGIKIDIAQIFGDISELNNKSKNGIWNKNAEIIYAYQQEIVDFLVGNGMLWLAKKLKPSIEEYSAKLGI